jgi:hypothetical protein
MSSTPTTRQTIVATFTGVHRAKQVIGKRIHTRKTTWAALVGAIVALVAAGSALAFQALPLAGQVNDDAAAGIDKTVSVNGEDPTNADVVGGALTAGKPAVPWAVFRQQETNGAPPPHDQIFARSFAGGAWTTRGNGTVGGRSSANPTFRGSLNFDQGADGEAPAIDFAGAGRTVPWASWYEHTSGTGFENNNIFASRFDNTGDANQGKWIFGGQGRGTGGGAVPVPSLNIHTDQSAENPSVAGGSAVDPTKPGPWVTWQETTNLPVDRKDQIFVSRPIGPGAANCDGVKPAGVEVSGHVPAVGGFCFQQTGVPRVGTGGTDPSLNIDPTRNGVEPDIAFTGSQDSVPRLLLGACRSDVQAGARDDGEGDVRGPQAHLGHGAEEGHEEGRGGWESECNAERWPEPNPANRAERHRQAAARKPSQAESKACGHSSNRERNHEDGLYADGYLQDSQEGP